ncbi:MAG: alpha-2-macroglobulin family protein, partial [Gammaproteobacteria bacterium]
MFEFAADVAPLGRMARRGDEVPFEVTPDPGCAWRWLSPATLACQLEDGSALAPATRYRIRTKPGAESIESVPLSGPVTHEFGTERPDFYYEQFRTWLGPGTPLIQVVMNQPVYPESVAGALTFRLPASGDEVPVRVYRDTDPSDDESAPMWQPTPAPAAQASRSFLVQPVRSLPEDATVHLAVGPGLESSLGPERGAREHVAVEFHTFASFEFLGVRCVSIGSDDWVLLRPSARHDPTPRCDPLASVGLVFSSPVTDHEIKDHLAFTPDLAAGRKDYDPWASRGSYSYLGQPRYKGEQYVVWLPERLKAYTRYVISSAAGSLRDEFGRALTSGIDMALHTDHRRPNLLTPHPEAVLEGAIDSEIPVVLTNLDRVRARFDVLGTAGLKQGLVRDIDVADVIDIAYAVPLGVRSMLGGRSGVVEGRLETEPAISHDVVQFFAQVSPFEVQTKLGHYDSVAWLVDLQTGQPVEGAEVTVVAARLDDLSEWRDLHEPVRTDASGTARLPGTDVLDPELAQLQAWESGKPRLMVRATKGDGHALLPLTYFYRTRQEDVFPHARARYGHLKAWGTTAQGVYRPGSLVQFKLYVRDESTRTLVAAPRAGFRLQVLDSQGKKVYERDALTLSEFGAHAGEFRLAENAAVGWYRFVLERGPQTQAGRSRGESSQALEPMRMLVSDFTPTPFKVSAELNGTRFAPGDALEMIASASLRSGGAYTDAPARLSVRLAPGAFSSDHPQARRFNFGSYSLDAEHAPESRSLLDDNGTLDDRGEFAGTLEVPDGDIYYGRLVLEASVRDDRGKSSAALASAQYAGRDRFVGLHAKRWLYREDEPSGVEYIVVDEAGDPVAEVALSLTVAREELVAARVKGAGNAYLTRYERVWQDVAGCADGDVLASGVQARTCVFVPEEPGLYRLRARIVDTHGRAQGSELYAWVAGKGEVLWDSGSDSVLSIVPEKSRVAVGDTARYLVRNPYPGATALVTVERYGVLESWVETLESSTPVISFEVEPDFVPGFYLSVSILSPRIEPPPAAAGASLASSQAGAPQSPAPALDDSADLGKPAARMGYVRVPVDDPIKQIDVKVVPAREVYEPRERVAVEIEAAPRLGGQREPIEIAVAVLDEAVFDLIQGGDAYFDPYRGFYRLENLDVTTFSLIQRLVGRINFQAKGASQGGDGGEGDAIAFRSMFKFVAHWNPGLRTDADGRVRFEFDAPDNLTAWRVLAIAVTPGDRMGLGVGRFRVNRATELRPVMPNRLLSGDHFSATVSVMNRTDRPRILRVLLEAEGDALEQPAAEHHTLALAPFKRRLVSLPLATARSGAIQISASAQDAHGSDGLRHAVPVAATR